MSKTLIAGALALGLIGTGITGIYTASANDTTDNPGVGTENREFNFGDMGNLMGDLGVSVDQMNEVMQKGDFEDMQQFMNEQNINFGQMKPYMEQMHPDLSNKELEEFYKGMHGTGGSSNSNNFQGMMNNY
ncbi:hypothetical protein [Thalassobacillus devorans]|jgi:hypothetical protein|uniref:hypothetical protein n=1 Tax=Thalassobacillus devorans TaxID=279813 RepID=UPI00048CAE7E|nr:hypothetical protein [Thalassobacillus devorans]